MIRIVDSDCIIVEKHCARFLEGHSVLSDVPAAFGLIPIETEIIHLYVVQNIENAFNVKFSRNPCPALRDKRARASHGFFVDFPLEERL